jgi:ectoine hydroxylase-related dioxygenase (phytanoyl-CoA dioxygenase family)
MSLGMMTGTRATTSHPETIMIAKQNLLELQENGYCVLRAHVPKDVIEACKDAFWPVLLTYLKNHGHEPNRGPHRHFLPMPFDRPCFAQEFFFDPVVLTIVRGVMGQRVVADQWGCDVPVNGSEYQSVHVDYRHPLFEEVPNLPLPPYMLVVSFALVSITPRSGPIEIAAGTHRMSREAALRSVECGESALHAVPLDLGDVLIRHPWTLHRGTPNNTDTPRALVTMRYVRRWYSDGSREVNAIPRAIWESLTHEQQDIMRFPIKN